MHTRVHAPYLDAGQNTQQSMSTRCTKSCHLHHMKGAVQPVILWADKLPTMHMKSLLHPIKSSNMLPPLFTLSVLEIEG